MAIFNSSEFTNVLHSVANIASNLGSVLEHFTAEHKTAHSIELGFINFLMSHLESHRQTLLPAPAPVVETQPVVEAPIESQPTQV